MKQLKHYLEKAQKDGFAIPQFNFSDFTQVKAVVEVAKKLNSPIILGTSEGESKFFGLKEAVAIRNVLRKKTGLPIFLNLDHGKTLEYAKEAINAGYDMVHIDGSKLSLEENIKLTKEVAKYAFWRLCLVEGEVGKIGTDSSKLYTEKFEIKEQDLTKPEEAKRFVEETDVDLLAISCGNFHGIECSGTDPHLRLDVIKKIKDVVDTGLVLHGGSGTPENDIKEAIKLGIVKININTELRLAFANGLRQALTTTDEIVPYKFLVGAQNEVEKIVELKINLFGSSNRA